MLLLSILAGFANGMSFIVVLRIRTIRREICELNARLSRQELRR
jgi:hypothetical protein